MGILLLLIGIPLFLEAKIGPIIRSNVNRAITGSFDFEDADLSLIRNFPNARVSLDGVRLTTAAPFEGDTLVTAGEAYLVMSLGELFKGEGEPIGIRELHISGADLRLELDAEGRPNYLIAVEPEGQSAQADPSEGFTFDLQDYDIRDSRISYRDKSTGISFILEDIQHSGSGDLSLAESELQTRTEARISFIMDSVRYLDRHNLDLDALIGIDLETETYTFLENQAHINQMPLVFEGSIQQVEGGQDIDLRFHTPSSDFENFLALIPATYTRDLGDVDASGSFALEGTITGRSDDTRIPGFDIRMEAVNAAFRYPDLPRGIDDINFNVRVINTSGNTADTYLEIPTAGFRIDRDAFSMNGKVEALTENPRVTGSLRGTINLAHLDQAYPVDLAPELAGILKADLTTAFDMASVENQRYQDTRTSGTLQLTDFSMKTDNFREPLRIREANLRFDPASARLENLTGTLGESDFSLKGSVGDYLGYMFGDALLKGDFTLESRLLKVEDFQSPAREGSENGEPAGGPAEGTAFQIPEDVDFTFRGRANRVSYDGLPLNNVSGTLVIRDQAVRIQEVRSDALDGKLALDGTLTTREGPSRFTMDLGIDGFRIRETLEAIELFETLAPIASIVEGTLNSKVRLSGSLREDLSLDLMSLAGNVAAEIFPTELSGTRAQVLQALDSRLSFFNVEDLDLKGLKTALNFENGMVNVQPFKITYRDIGIEVAGSHSFDQQINYTATLQVPAKYLGNEVNRLVSELQEPGLEEATIPVVARIGGEYSNPTVQTDLEQAVSSLTSRLVEAQKQKLLASGKDKAKDLIGSIMKGSSDSTGTASDSTRAGLGNVIKGVIGGNRSDTTAVKADSQPSTGGNVEKSARKILGGLLGKKRDTTNAARDSLQ